MNKVQPDLASEIRHGIFGGLNFGPGISWGFDGSTMDFLGGWILAPIQFIIPIT